MPRSTGARAAQAEETRSALIRAARRLFAHQGFHATGTAEIVAAAGVTRGALQHHFPRKEALFLAVFEQIEQDMMAAAAPAHGGAQSETVVEPGGEARTEADSGPAGDAWLRLRANLATYLAAATTPEVQRIILLDGPAVLGWAEWRRLEAHYGLGAIVAAVQEGMVAGHIRHQPAGPLAQMILSIINEAALMVANAPEPAAATKDARIALETLLSSLA